MAEAGYEAGTVYRLRGWWRRFAAAVRPRHGPRALRVEPDGLWLRVGLRQDVPLLWPRWWMLRTRSGRSRLGRRRHQIPL